MSIFTHEQTPVYVTLALQRLTLTFGELKRTRFESYERILTRRGITQAALERAACLAEERWDRWQMPAELLTLCAEARDTGHREPISEATCEDHWNRSLRSWQFVLEQARQSNNAHYLRVAPIQIEKCHEALDRLARPVNEAEVAEMRANLDWFGGRSEADRPIALMPDPDAHW